MTEPRPSNLNVPNVLTVLRIIMVPQQHRKQYYKNFEYKVRDIDT